MYANVKPVAMMLWERLLLERGLLLHIVLYFEESTIQEGLLNKGACIQGNTVLSSMALACSKMAFMCVLA